MTTTNMTDRELLELAAKAAGIEPIWGLRLTQTGQAGVCGETIYHRDECIKLAGRNWDPLTDDGDALRLAMALSIDIMWCSSGRVIAVASAGDRVIEVVESTREDREESTRRAITRAAAEMGGQP